MLQLDSVLHLQDATVDFDIKDVAYILVLEGETSLDLLFYLEIDHLRCAIEGALVLTDQGGVQWVCEKGAFDRHFHSVHCRTHHIRR